MNVEIRKERNYATGSTLFRIYKDGKASVAFKSKANAEAKAEAIRAREIQDIVPTAPIWQRQSLEDAEAELKSAAHSI